MGGGPVDLGGDPGDSCQGDSDGCLYGVWRRDAWRSPGSCQADGRGMKLGLLTTTHIEHPVQLGLLRLLVDSVRLQVPRDHYDQFLIVDDCSPEDAATGAY